VTRDCKPPQPSQCRLTPLTLTAHLTVVSFEAACPISQLYPEIMENMYIYEPLKSPLSIRILELFPAKTRNARLRCQLKEGILGTHEPRTVSSINDNSAQPDGFNYEALSYAWESQILDRPVIVRCENGVEQILLISCNVEAALRRLRLKTERRRLWIDSTCIDQSSIPERNTQVAHMDDIYRSAQRVLVWLGEGNAAVVKTIRFIKELGTEGKWNGRKLLDRRRSQFMRGSAGELWRFRLTVLS
jgi:hypothetical protein